MIDLSKERLARSVPTEGAGGRTGSWRVFRPVVDRGACNACGLCGIYCPDGCIDADLNVDIEYCKGCGVCANECPKKAIAMVREER